MNNSWLIKHGRIVDPLNGRDEVGDVFIKDGLIADPTSKIPKDTRVIEATGLLVVPGFIDLHVHFREPGNEEAETIESGSKAAALGGFTTVVTMPNTTPATDNPETITFIKRKAVSLGLVNLLPSGCITKGRKGVELADLAAMAEAGAVAFTDDGSTVANEGLMARAMKIAAALNMPVMDHALDPAIAGKGVMHDGKRSKKLGLPGIPSSAETEIVRRDIKLARQTGCHVHIQHISAMESVELIRQARKEGIAVSGEATPHHLAFTDDDITADNTNLKMNPPVRSKEDRKSLLSAVVDGTLEVLATDHAPHRADEKANDFIHAPFGVVGLETAAGVTFALLVKTGLMSISEWLRRWTIGPAHVLGLAPPALSAGRQADLAILDISSEWTVKSTEFVSKSKNTPFEGWKLACRPVYTFHRGLIVWTERQSKD